MSGPITQTVSAPDPLLHLFVCPIKVTSSQITNRRADALRADMYNCAHRVDTIRTKLEAIASAHRHRKHEIWCLGGWSPPRSRSSSHHGKRLRELHDEWEGVWADVERAISQFNFRIQQQVEDKKKADEKANKETEKRKKEAEEVKRRADEALKRETDRGDKLQTKVTGVEDHWTKRREDQERSDDHVREEVQKAGLSKLNQDPVEGLERVVKAMKTINETLGLGQQQQDPIGDIKEIGAVVVDMNDSFGHSGGRLKSDPVGDVGKLANVVVDLNRATGCHHGSHNGTPIAVAMSGANAPGSSPLDWSHGHDRFCPHCSHIYGHHDYHDQQSHANQYFGESETPSRVVINNRINGQEIEVEEASTEDGHTSSGRHREHRTIRLLHRSRSWSSGSSVNSSTSDKVEVHGDGVQLVHHNTAQQHRQPRHQDGSVVWNRVLDRSAEPVLERLNHRDGVFQPFTRDLEHHHGRHRHEH